MEIRRAILLFAIVLGLAGLDGTAQPGTPARFDLLVDGPGRYPIAFTPANGADGRTIGVLQVRE